MSTFEDCQRFLDFVAECFVEKPVTVDNKRVQKLRAATAAREEVNNRLPTIEICNGEIHEMNEEKQVLKDTPKTQGSAQTMSNSQGGAYVLTNIYIYPIKSCGAYEVWPFLPCFPSLPLSLSLSLVCPGLMQCCVLHAGPRLAVGTPGFTPRQELDGGEWERCVSQPKESATFVPHSPRGPPALKPIASAGIRSDRVNGPI